MIAVASLLVAPIFQCRLNEQFLLGARNQAFLTEHIAGFETVKTLQMEPQLEQRYGGYLATYLPAASAPGRSPTPTTPSRNALDQLMTLLILMVGAWTVMTQPTLHDRHAGGVPDVRRQA